MGSRRCSYLALLALLVAPTGCSFFDFFGYEDNAPLHVIERPEGYPSGRFGAEIAPTSTTNEPPIDLLVASGGEGTPTIIYRVAAEGDLVDVEDPWDQYLKDQETEARTTGSGAALAGLPVWGNDLLPGCVAVGEPDAESVEVLCEDDDMRFTIPVTAQPTYTEPTFKKGFGRYLAAIRPFGGDNWLLGIAAARWAMIFNTTTDHSEPLVPEYAGVPYPGKIQELAAGRLADGRIFAAAATAGDDDNVFRVHLFTQDHPTSAFFPQVGCVNRSGEEGFGGVMTTGDLDGDGADELLVAAGDAAERVAVVYVYDVAELEAAAPLCNSDAPDPVAIIEPGDGPRTIDCDDDCDFGLALAVGDIATDDEGPEVIVGAPGARVDGTSNAGAVFVYRGAELMADGGAEPASRVAHSAPESSLRFGGGVAVVPMAGRNELVVGEIGKGRLVIAFCTGVGEDLEEGADVTHNANGSVLSTRCRP